MSAVSGKEHILQEHKSQGHITIEEFACSLVAQSDNPTKECGCDDNCKNADLDAKPDLEAAVRMGLIDEYEILHGQDPLEKRIAARILHRALRNIMKESDEEDWSGAYPLKDLFDCHTCVGDIAQIYVKGIIESCGECFGIHQPVSREEAQLYLERVWDRNKRTPVQGSRQSEFATVPLETYFEKITEIYTGICIDIRGREEYMNHPRIERSMNIPFKKIFLNPYCVSETGYTKLYLYSDSTYESTAAANLLIKAGFCDVTVII